MNEQEVFQEIQGSLKQKNSYSTTLVLFWKMFQRMTAIIYNIAKFLRFIAYYKNSNSGYSAHKRELLFRSIACITRTVKVAIIEKVMYFCK